MKKLSFILFILILSFGQKLNAETINQIYEGNIDAKVTIITYESLTCGHCADFHKNVYPDLKKEFIDTGLVKIEFRHFPLDMAALNASKIAQCKNDGKSDLLHFLFSNQKKWVKGETVENANENLKKLLKDENIDVDFEKCINNKSIEDYILNNRIEAVKKYKAHAGISFDGDADRIIMCDENGKIIDGDQIIAMLARRWKSKKILKGGVIGTLMSNYGLENFLKKEKIKFFRSKVGDRYVKEKMKKLNFNLGGEQSGHIILGKFATTGDGLMVALEVLFSLRKGKKASKLLNVFVPMPQILENITVKDKNIINKSKCKSAIKKANKLMSKHGRLLIRKSGTEPKIRIMGESYNKKLILRCIKLIKRSIK